MFGELAPQTLEELLLRTTQQELFSFYLGKTAVPGNYYRNPLRHDRQAGCRLFVGDDGKWRLYDHSRGESMDIMDIVSSRGMLDFRSSLVKVVEDLRLNNRPLHVSELRSQRVRQPSVKADLSAEVQPFTQTDAEYLRKRGITRQIAEYFRIYSIRRVFLGGRVVYVHNQADPALGYYHGQKQDRPKWKFYFYQRTKQSTGPKFMSNTNRPSGWPQLPQSGELLVLTKSMKDVACMFSCGLTALSMQSEAHIPYQEIAEHLQTRFSKIVTLYDFDAAGVRAANKMRKLYGWTPLFLTDGRFGTHDHQAKDFSDFYVRHGRAAALDLAEQIRTTHFP